MTTNSGLEVIGNKVETAPKISSVEELVNFLEKLKGNKDEIMGRFELLDKSYKDFLCAAADLQVAAWEQKKKENPEYISPRSGGMTIDAEIKLAQDAKEEVMLGKYQRYAIRKDSDIRGEIRLKIPPLTSVPQDYTFAVEAYENYKKINDELIEKYGYETAAALAKVEGDVSLALEYLKESK